MNHDDSDNAPTLAGHRFDPISAILGIVAMLGGVMVVIGDPNPIGGSDVGVWIAVAVILIGVTLFPWGRGPWRTKRRTE